MSLFGLERWGEFVEAEGDITWLRAQLPESSPPLLLPWLLAANCRARMVPSSATNQRGWNPAGARRRWKSQRSRNRQRRRPARRTVRVQKPRNRLRCFTRALLKHHCREEPLSSNQGRTWWICMRQTPLTWSSVSDCRLLHTHLATQMCRKTIYCHFCEMWSR